MLTDKGQTSKLVTNILNQEKEMITTVIIHQCHFCQGTDIVRNGIDYKGDQKFYCHGCGSYGTLNPHQKYSAEKKAEVLRTYQERASMAGVRRIFGVAQRTLQRWLQEAEAALSQLADLMSSHRPNCGLLCRRPE